MNARKTWFWLVGLLMVIAQVSAVSALTDKTWTGSASTNWFTASNWSPSGVPTVSNKVLIPSTSRSPVVSGYGNQANCGELNVGWGSAATLTIQNGGYLNVNSGAGNISLGINTNGNGTLNLNCGTLWCNNLYVKPSGSAWGQLNVIAGRAVCQSTVYLNGRINAYYFGGCVVAGNISIGTGAAMELKLGRLLLSGDKQGTVSSYISQGKIYGNGSVLYDYNTSQSGYTTVYATTKTVSSPISWTNQSNQTISGKFFRNASGHAITLTNCNNITITNCEFQGNLNHAIKTSGGHHFWIYNNKFRDGAGGVRVHNATGTVVLNSNWLLNCRPGFTPDGYYANGFSILNSSGSGYEVSYNRIDHLYGQAAVAVFDNINLYQVTCPYGSSGEGMAQVRGNYIRSWGGTFNSSTDYGAGIQLVDGGGEQQKSYENYMVNPNHAGQGISGGRHTQVYSNLIYGDSWTPRNSAVGVIYNDYSHIGNCHDHGYWSNRVNWYSRSGYPSGFYSDGRCWNLNDYGGNNFNDSGITWSILPDNLFP